MNDLSGVSRGPDFSFLVASRSIDSTRAYACVVPPLALLHVVAVFVWFGVVAAEVSIELRARDDDGMRRAASEHYWIDAVVEVPLLALVLGTGLLLTARAWPLDAMRVAMVVTGTVAVAANVACVGFVVARERGKADPTALRLNRRRVFACGILGAPFGLAAAAIGLRWMLGAG